MTYAYLASPRSGDPLQIRAHNYACETLARLIPHCPDPTGFGPATSFLAMRRNPDAILGAVVLHNYHPRLRTIEISAAADDPRWVSKGVLGTILRYVFCPGPEGLDCVRVQMVIPRRGPQAKRARRFAKGIGFVYEGIARLGFGDDDAVIFSMLAADAHRWTGDIDGQTDTQRAA